jgi:hypothetical protein
MIILKLTLVIFFVHIIGCSQSTQSDNPEWVDELIRKFKSEPVGNPPQSIWRYDYKGQVVYYIPPQCCDQFSTLFDAEGNVICAPDGGFSGTGDGRCPDFFTKRTNEKLIWKDTRTG